MSQTKASSPGLAATVFFTVLGQLSFVLGTILCGLLTTFASFVPPRGRWADPFTRLWSHIFLRSAGVRTRGHFTVSLAKNEGYVYMANHQSMMDIPALLITLPGSTRMLAKKGLFMIPIFGWSIWAAGFIPVDRKNRSTAKATFAAAVRCLEGGRSILVFPEETRSYDGELLPFKSGGFLMALKTGYPIVPVGIRGTLEARRRGSYVNRPGRVEVRYGEPIDVKSYGVRRKGELMDEVRARIEELKNPRVETRG